MSRAQQMVAVPGEFFSTVFFLCVDKQGDDGVFRHTPAATGFFVKVPFGGRRQLAVDYLVTARHCIEDARADGYDTLFARFNKKGGGFAVVKTRIDDWREHDSADVAAALALPSALADGLAIADVEAVSLRLADFVGAAPDYTFRGEVETVGPVTVQPRVGHEIYFLGLFTEHAGSDRNLPIARFGHIARMPELIEVQHRDQWFRVIAYLAEFHSIGGHSGSPVFFLHPMILETGGVDERGAGRTTFDLAHLTGFMGLISGHYDIPKFAKTTDDVGEVEVGLNAGIAMVTPAAAVRELLMRTDLMAERGRLSI